MIKADNVHSTTACPVQTIALRVGQLWAASAEEQERDAGENELIGDQLDDLRQAVAETASFLRARSLGGALFQVALASETAERLFQELPEEERLFNRTHLKLNRLLILIAAQLRDEMGPDAFAKIKDIIEMYLDFSQERALLDAIPYPPSEKVVS
jgi:hypothetical protein